MTTEATEAVIDRLNAELRFERKRSERLRSALRFISETDYQSPQTARIFAESAIRIDQDRIDQKSMRQAINSLSNPTTP